VKREPSVRTQIHTPKTTGDRAADVVATAMGSWRFIIIQSAIVAAWIALNLVAVARHFDPYPFILLNLLFSTQAAYAAPIIMMSQNRQAAKDRQRDDHEAVTVDATADIVALTHENTKEIRRLAREQAAILAAQDRVLEQQTEMLTLLREHPARSDDDPDGAAEGMKHSIIAHLQDVEQEMAHAVRPPSAPPTARAEEEVGSDDP
jgi:uncharacterized membrane protein